MIKRIALSLAAVAMLAACQQDRSGQQAEALLQQATQQYQQKHYDNALSLIDSLRHTYPKAVDARKQALTLQQHIEEARAQEDLAAVDQALQKATADYEAARSVSEAHHAAGTATAEELSRTTLLRIARDSLQVQFDLLCAKVKYYRQKKQQTP